MNQQIQARGLETIPVVTLPAAKRETAPEKRQVSEMLDAINLNVDGDQGVTMTFVEQVDDDEDAE